MLVLHTSTVLGQTPLHTHHATQHKVLVFAFVYAKVFVLTR